MNEAQAFVVVLCISGLYVVSLIMLSKLYDICNKLDKLIKAVKRDD